MAISLNMILLDLWIKKASKIEALEGELVFIQGHKMKRLNQAEASVLL